MSTLQKDEIRALRILKERAAHELQDQPLRTLEHLKRIGFVAVTRIYTERHNGRLWHCQIVEITKKGLDYLRSLEPGAGHE